MSSACSVLEEEELEFMSVQCDTLQDQKHGFVPFAVGGASSSGEEGASPGGMAGRFDSTDEHAPVPSSPVPGLSTRAASDGEAMVDENVTPPAPAAGGAPPSEVPVPRPQEVLPRGSGACGFVPSAPAAVPLARAGASGLAGHIGCCGAAAAAMRLAAAAGYGSSSLRRGLSVRLARATASVTPMVRAVPRAPARAGNAGASYGWRTAVQERGQTREGAAVPDKAAGGAGSRFSRGTVPPLLLRLKLPATELTAALRGAQGCAAGSDPASIWPSLGRGSGASLPLGAVAAVVEGGAAACVPTAGSGAAASPDGSGSTAFAGGPGVAVASLDRRMFARWPCRFLLRKRVEMPWALPPGCPTCRPPGSPSAMLVDGVAGARPSPPRLLPSRPAAEPGATVGADEVPAQWLAVIQKAQGLVVETVEGPTCFL